MLRFFRRKPLPVEWHCGPERAPRILDALATATHSNVSLYREGSHEWTADVAIVLHEFTCTVLERVLAFASDHNVARLVPAYVHCQQREGDDAPDTTDQANGSLEQIVLEFPALFRDVLSCKRKWIVREADDEDIQKIAEAFSEAVRDGWPSGFCLGINGIRNAEWCALSALNVESPWDAAYRCATTAANFAGCHVACTTVDCSTAFGAQNELVWESGNVEGQVLARGVGCPQALDRRIERRMSSTLDATVRDWWSGLNDQLEASLFEL